MMKKRTKRMVEKVMTSVTGKELRNARTLQCGGAPEKKLSRRDLPPLPTPS
ncbi:hypothetical protein OS493_017698 [Desmophyllum pertusum]|uniref:Uncharacterized protein n=1 Tax=Desmophyllum pertusum TaxID=174260 RepID=A0A9W9ZDE0_9CNID|nr:hypothetical protein OS493_017698 [Desmophyllum pertusum]